MPNPPDPKDDAAPVVLQEPTRAPAASADGGVWRHSGAGGLVEQGRDFAANPAAIPDLHRGWEKVLAADETPLWQGSPAANLRLGVLRALADRPGRLIFVVIIGAVVVMNMGINPGFMPVVLISLYLFLRSRLRAVARPQTGAQYLLTNRAAYLAVRQGAGLAEITAYPITPELHLGLGPRSVSFATRPGRDGRPEPVGFHDISDAAQVHALIRDIQKGQT